MMAFLVGTGMVAGGFTAAYGQEVDEKKAEEGGYSIEEIVVTAEKREENINDVPLTITAFDSKAIQELGIVDEGDLEALTPGLQFGQHETSKNRPHRAPSSAASAPLWGASTTWIWALRPM